MLLFCMKKYRTPYDIAVARNMITLAEYLSSELSRSAAKNELEIYRKSNYGVICFYN